MERLVKQGAGEDGIVLDFFAGSGSTAHAVLDLNNQYGGNRKFILVQLPEPTDRKDFPTIADITKERVRRVIKKLTQSRRDAEKTPELHLSVSASPRETDFGFKAFKLAESNFKPWNAGVSHEAAALEQQLEMHIDHIREGRTANDLLYEILLKSGFPLTTPVETLTLAGNSDNSDRVRNPVRVHDNMRLIWKEDPGQLQLILSKPGRHDAEEMIEYTEAVTSYCFL
jgi:adenine-specific DNA-methyltransferase